MTMLGKCWLFSLGCLLLQPPAIAADACGSSPTKSGCLLKLAQTESVKGQDPETAGKGEGATGWVQAPVPRGHNPPEQTAQGAGSAPVATPDAKASTGQAQPSAGQNPGTPVKTPLPGPAGVASAPGKK